MKQILYIFILVCFLNAQEEQKPMATQLEMFLFKIGFTSLVNDVNNEKNITHQNSADIKEIKANIKYILEMLNKDKLNQMSESTVSINQVKTLPISKKKQSEITIRVEEAYVRKAPFLNAPIVKTLHYGDVVDIEYCNKYDWCKFKDHNLYIAKYLLDGMK